MASIVRVGAKFGIVGGAVYGTNKLGVWNDSSHTEKIYKDLYKLTSSYLRDIPIEVPELPHLPDITSEAKNYWNSGVLVTGKFLLDLPELTMSFVKEGYSTLSNQINSPSAGSS